MINKQTKKKAPPFPFTYIPILDQNTFKIKKSKREKKEVLETNMTSRIKRAKNPSEFLFTFPRRVKEELLTDTLNS